MKKLYLWMLIPFSIAILGFYFSYWSKFMQVPFDQHLHGITATAWFVLLVIQPYLIEKGDVRSHRFFGMMALFLAGGVVFSAAQVIPNNITNENLSMHLRYGLSFFDFLILIGFSASVILAIKNVKNRENHKKWMISTVFWSLMPALSRLIYFPMLIIFGYPTPVSFTLVVGLCGLAAAIIIGIIMIMDKKIHPAYILAASVNLLFFFVEPIGNWSWWIQICEKLV